MAKKTVKRTKSAASGDASPPHHHLIAEIAGWIGAASLLSGYLLISNHIITSNDLIYHLLNLVGACGLIVIALTKKLYQLILINTVWMIVAVAALIGLLI